MLQRATLGLAFGLGVPVLVLLGLVLYLLHSAERVDHTGEIISNLHSLEKSVVDMETGLRGLQLTGDERFLQPFAAVRAGLDQRLDSLFALLVDNPAQRSAMEGLRREVSSWEAFSEQALLLEQTAPGAVRALEFNLRGKTLMDSVRRRVAEMIATEEQLREKRTLRMGRVRFTLFTALASALLLGTPLATLWMRRLLKKASETYHESLTAAEGRAKELRVTLRSIGDAVVATNASGEVAFLNPVAELLMGWTSAEAYGRPLEEVFAIFSEETGAPAENPVVRVLRERVVVGLANHTVIRSRSGVERPIEDSAAPIFDDEGAIKGVILVFHDVGDKREVERRLYEAEWRSRIALEVGGAGSWVWEIERDRVTGDAMMARTFGLPLESCVTGEKSAKFLAPVNENDRERVRATLRDAVKSGNPYEAEFRVSGEGGSWRWVYSRGRVELDPGGKPGRVLGFMIDITATRLAEEALRESERRFRLLNDLGEATRTLSDPRQIMATVARLLGEHLRVSRCAYADVEDDGEHFTIQDDFTKDCLSTVGDYDLSLFGPRASAELRAGSTLVIRDVDAELPLEAGAGMFNAIGIKAIVCCPLLKDGSLRAMMAVHQDRPRDWAAPEIELIREVVERCWATIERARAEAELKQRARFSALRADIGTQLAFGGALDGTLQVCCELLVAHLEGARAQAWTLSSAQVLELRADARPDSPEESHPRVALGESRIGLIAQSRQAFLSNDVARDLDDHQLAAAGREGVKSMAGYPLVVNGRMLGVFAVFSRQKLSEAEFSDLAPIADGLSQCIERKRAEAALLSSETLKSAILDTALDGFILMDHEGRIADWNTAAEQIFGLPRADAIGRLLGDTIVPERMREAHRLGLQRYVSTREARILGRRYELPAVRSDGTEFPSEISISHIPGTEPPLFAGYVRDITERKQAEAELRAATGQAEAAARAVAESAERFRLVAEVVSLQVWTAQLNGRLDFANQECVQYFGVDSERDILGHSWAQFVHPDDLDEVLPSWQNSLATGARYEVEFRLRGATGDFRWFLVRAEAMRDGEGQIARWFGTNTDIHALKLAQSDAERASRAKDAFLAALSHELRTPLTPVLMTAAALREDERLPMDVREQLGMMERNIALEARLIDDLLDLTRIANGKLHLRLCPCDAHSLIGLAVEIVRDEALAKGLLLERDFAALHSGLMTDPARFQQVIWNLLRNAVKFTPRGGRLSIRTSDRARGEPGWLRIEVSDSGVGIAPGSLDQIFLPFEQGDLAGDHRFGGMGLGLAIARAIVDLHGGTITAHSAGPNLGSTFVVDLPGASEPPHGVGDPRSHEAPSDASSTVHVPQKESALRLLLVEDHEPTLQVLSRLLTRAGHHVISAGTIADGLAAAAANPFDLVVSDLGLPDGTGTELMEVLRDIYGLRGIALTGYGMEDDIARSREAGFSMHLIKPVDFHQLQRALREVAGF